jgi:hypothetical protein
MFRALFTLALAASAAGGQAGTDAPHPIPEPLRAHLRGETFTPLTSVGALPDGVKRELADLFGTKQLELADPGAPFQATDVVVHPRLPWRRLVSAGCGADHCVVHYERGGFVHVYQALVLARQGDTVRFVWGGALSGPIGDVQGVRDAIAAGKVIGQTRHW